MPTQPFIPRLDGSPPVHYCGCGAPIGDGDWASGRRSCAMCQRPPRRWTRLPTPRR